MASRDERRHRGGGVALGLFEPHQPWASGVDFSEICLAGKASVLVPFPNASEDHQTENALSLVRQKAALLVKDNEAQEILIKTALETLANKTLLESLASASLSMGKPKAAQEIAATLLS